MTPEQRTRFVDVAVRIGRRIVRDARWDGDRLLWSVTGRRYTAEGPRAGDRFPAGPNLYSGSAGVAFALAELARVTGDRVFREAAMGTMRGSMTAPLKLFSFHCGDVGRAWVAVRLARALGSAEFLGAAQRMVDDARAALPDDQALDVIGGAAGAIPPLLQLASDGELRGAKDLAVAAGEHITARAARRVSGWSWRTATDPLQDLCGYAHGVSGFVHAYLELFATTKDLRWRHAAVRGLQHESFHRIPGTGDWPDYRCMELGDLRLRPNGEELVHRRLSSVKDPYRPQPGAFRAWCHGAPGIALVRARATALGFECGDELEASFRSALASIGSLANASLCHGSIGNAEAILHAPTELRAEMEDEAVRRVEGVIDRLGDGARPWPTGAVAGSLDPSLMLGEAGMIHGLLRFADPATPAITFVSTGATPAGIHAKAPVGVLRAEVDALMPRLATAVSRDARLESRLTQVLEGLPVDAPVSRLLDAVESGLREFVTPSSLRTALRQDRAVLAAEGDFTNYIEHLAATTRAAAADDIGLDDMIVLSGDCTIVDGCDADDPSEALPPVLVMRTLRSVTAEPLPELQHRVLRALEVPGSIRGLEQRLRDETDDAGPGDPSLMDALEAFVNVMLKTGILARIEAHVPSRVPASVS